MSTKTVGDRGENLAADYLEQKGLSILERKYRTPVGEIDLIVREGRTLVSVEVKTRKSARYGRPAAAVGREKQRRIVRAALWYMNRKQGETPPCRFDVVEIYAQPGGAWSVQHIEEAFEAERI